MDELKLLLAGVDFSPRSHTAAQMAVFLAKKAGASVEMMHVIESRITDTDAQILGLDRDDVEQAEINESNNELNALAEQLECDDIQTKVVFGNAAESLARRYREIGADLLIIGDTGTQSLETRHGTGVTAYRLVENGPENVLVVKPSYNGVLDRIAAAVDFSSISDNVIRQAMLIAKLTGAHLFVVHAFSTHTSRVRRLYGEESANKMIMDLQQYNENLLREFIQRFDDLSVSIEPVVLAGSITQPLLGYLQDEKIDLVVVGTGTTPRIAGFPLGSTTHAIVNQAPASVFIVRPGE